MLDFVMGIGFAFVIEGVIWGLFPHQIVKVIQQIAETDEQMLRYIGVASVGLGVAIIWYVHHSRMGGV